MDLETWDFDKSCKFVEIEHMLLVLAYWDSWNYRKICQYSSIWKHKLRIKCLNLGYWVLHSVPNTESSRFWNTWGLLFLALTSRHQSSNPRFGSCQTWLVSEIVVKGVVLILGVYSYKNSNNDAVFANLGPINSVN